MAAAGARVVAAAGTGTPRRRGLWHRGHGVPLTRMCALHEYRAGVQPVRGLREAIMDGATGKCRYDLLLLDQFGVLHDGRTPYAGAQETVRSAFSMGLPSIIISNSSRRSRDCAEGLRAKGFNMDEILGCVTSGEIVHENLKQPRRKPAFSSLGSRCIHITWAKRGSGGIDLETSTTGVRAVGDDVDDADFVLMHGTEAIGRTVSTEERGECEEELQELTTGDIIELLRKCADRGLPMIVANPDVFTVDGDKLQVMPGWFAGQYGKLGGTFALMGKPNRIIFEAALDQYREKASGGGDAPVVPRVLVVGDSLVHDIGGGTNNGFDTLLITSGIHQREIYGTEDTESPRRCAPGDDEAIANRIVEMCREFECALPTYFTEKFVF